MHVRMIAFVAVVSMGAGVLGFCGISKGSGDVAVSPTGPAAERISLGALASRGEWLKLLAASSESMSKTPSDPSPVGSYLQALRMLGKTDEALIQADAALQRFPNTARLLLERAWIQAFKGKWSECLSDAHRAFEGDPHLLDALMLQGIAYREMREWKRAETVFSRMADLQHENAMVWLNRGRVYAEQRNWKEALADLNQCLALDPKSAEACYQRGRVYDEQGNLSSACDEYSRALQLQPECAAPYVARASALARLSRWTAAEQDVKTAMALGDRSPRICRTACQVAVALGDWNALTRYARAGEEADPESADFSRFAGQACREQGNWKIAIAAYDRALKLDPHSTAIRVERAACELVMRQYAEAEADYNAVLEQNLSAAAYALRGFARLRMGKLDGAREDSTNALTLDPKMVTALLVKAQILLQENRPAEALDLSRNALKLDPSQSWAYVVFGCALLGTGHGADALKALDQSVVFDPGNGEAYLARGRCQAALDHADLAQADFKMAVALDPSLKPDVEKAAATLPGISLSNQEKMP